LTGERVQRRLAAILAADVAGYSRLMGRDENGTLTRLKAHRAERFEPTLARHGGRLVKLTGVLVEFASAVRAVEAAIEFQQAMAEANRSQAEDTAIVFRIGLHLGDLIVDGDDLYGDGVNVAARLEGEAPPGSIVVSGDVHSAVAGRTKAQFVELGDLSLKNIERSVRAYRVAWNADDWVAPASTSPTAGADMGGALLPLPDKPSIAVLPFQNMSGDPEQEYFADGMVEEIITALSRFKSLFVIARNSSFAYKGQIVDVRKAGRELGVRYVLEGSVRKAASRLRITGQLIESETGVHLWADRFDGALEEVFDLQDRITMSVVSAIAPKIDQAEIDRARRKSVANLDAYDCYLRGLARFAEDTDVGDDAALRLFYDAIARDPGFTAAYGMAAHCYAFLFNTGRVEDREKAEAETRRLSRHASILQSDDARALSEVGHALAYVGEHERGATLIDRALAINPNLARGWGLRGWVSTLLGEHEAARQHFEQALRLSPLDPGIADWERGMAAALFFMDDYRGASEWANRALAHQPERMMNLRMAAAANALAGHIGQARDIATRLVQRDPALRTSRLRDYLAYRRPQDLELIAKGLRLAGVPE
jgi:adenylate cyclase